MANLVSLDEARLHLRLDSNDADDMWLQMWIAGVSDAVISWLKDPWRAYVLEIDSSGEVVIDSSGDPVPTDLVRNQVKIATLLELASMYRYREGGGQDNVVTADAGYGYVLNKASTNMLTPLRRPTVR